MTYLKYLIWNLTKKVWTLGNCKKLNLKKTSHSNYLKIQLKQGGPGYCRYYGNLIKWIFLCLILAGKLRWNAHGHYFLLWVGSSHHHASLGTICVQVGQLFGRIRNRRHFPLKTAILPLSKVFFKNISLYMKCRLPKICSVHTYYME